MKILLRSLALAGLLSVSTQVVAEEQPATSQDIDRLMQSIHNMYQKQTQADAMKFGMSAPNQDASIGNMSYLESAKATESESDALLKQHAHKKKGLNLGQIMAETNLSPQDYDAAMAFIKDLFKIDKEDASKEEKQEDADKKAILPAEYSLYHMLALRRNVLNGDKSMESSLMEKMKEEAYSRIMNAKNRKGVEWDTSVAKASTEALLRELVMIEAVRLFLDYETFRQGERMEMLMAVTALSQGNLGGAVTEFQGRMDDSQEQADADRAAAEADMPSDPSLDFED